MYTRCTQERSWKPILGRIAITIGQSLEQTSEIVHGIFCLRWIDNENGRGSDTRVFRAEAYILGDRLSKLKSPRAKV